MDFFLCETLPQTRKQEALGQQIFCSRSRPLLVTKSDKNKTKNSYRFHYRGLTSSMLLPPFFLPDFKLHSLLRPHPRLLGLKLLGLTALPHRVWLSASG